MKPVSNPPNPWDSTHREYLDTPPPAALEVFEEEARSILSENRSPDIPFRFSVNPYRGCFHGCAYCYARPTHQYLGWGAGTDFDRKIVVKTNAAELLRHEMGRPRYRGEAILFSGNTDCYQPLEASYGLTRACLDVCARLENPAVIITKGSLVRRDVDVLVRLHESARTAVFVSIPFATNDVGRLLEPFASPASERFETLRILSEAGIPTGVGIAPIVPGLTESHIPEILERSREAGCTHAFYTLLRLPLEVAQVFEERIGEALPDRKDRILSAVRELRGGKLNVSGFGHRMKGEGARWEMIRQMFHTTCNRLGLMPRAETFAPRVEKHRQERLFEEEEEICDS